MLENRIFTGGLDQDSSDELIANGDYPYALNCRVSTVGNIGQITNSMGTVEIVTQLPSGTNQVIGSFQNKQTKKLYYFLYNSNAEHTIYEFDGQNINAVLTTPLFNFNPDYKITGVTMIGDLLYWTDNLNESMVVDVERGKAGQYIAPYKLEYFTQIKKPPLNPPTALYVNAFDRRVNYLKNKLFQFKTRFVYKDNSKSVTSPISNIPFPGSSCSGPSETTNNALDITFYTGSTEVIKIELLFREGNEGDFYLIDTFIKAEASIPSETDWSYRWYNDGIYNTIPLNESIQLYDDIPQTYKALDLIPGNRIARANGTHQFDQVDVQAAMVVDYQDTASTEETFNLRGRIYIRNPYSADSRYAAYQPITKNQDDEYCVWGGFSDVSHGNNIDTEYGQILPCGGFVVYLAGTSYYAISRQVAVDGVDTWQNTGAFLNDSGPQRSDIRDAIKDGKVYSEFVIPNVPKGRYSLRIAGVRMPNGQPMLPSDLNDISLEYQTTSTYTIRVGSEEGFEKIFSATSGDYDIGYCEICDLRDNRISSQSFVADGYVVDNNINGATGFQIIQNDRIEYCYLYFKVTPSTYVVDAWNSVLVNNNYLKQWTQQIARTDHNGFFFYSFMINAPLAGIAVIRAEVRSINNLTIKQYNEDIFDEVGNNIGSDFSSNGERNGYVIRNYNALVTQEAATYLTGNVNDGVPNPSTGIPTGVASVRVVCKGTSRWVDTGPSGDYSIRVFGRAVPYSILNGPNINNILFDLNQQDKREFEILFSYQGACYAQISPQGIPGTVPAFSTLLPSGGFYDNTHYYPVTPDGVITFTSNTVCGFKHGGSYKFGIVYADEFGRLSTTMTNNWTASGGQSLNVNIPFELDTNGMTGIPSLRMSIFSQPPSWAKKYYIVRTKNTAMDYYLRFLVNSVAYMDYENTDTEQLMAPGTGSHIKLNFYNVTPSSVSEGSFLDRNPGSILSLSYVKGMRVRLISQPNGTYYNGYWDMEVTGIKDASLVFYVNNDNNMPIIENGSLVEIYVPKLNAKEQIFYEVAAAGDIVNGYHMGIDGQSQTATQEAIARIKNGDTYYRMRNMPFYSGTVTAIDEYPGSSSTRRVLIEDPSYSDLVELKVQNIGRPNVVDKNVKKTHRPSTVWYSGQYIRDTFINRLNNVPLTAFEDYPEQHGPITKLYSGVASGDNMGSNIVDIYQTNRVGSILVDEFAATSSSSQQGILVGTQNVLSKTAKYYQGEIGLSNPESFAHYTERRYFADSMSQQAARLSNDGIEPISEYKMSAYFFDKLEYLKKGQCTICAGYDTENMEYVLSFSKITLTPDKTRIVEVPFDLPITNGEFTTLDGWEQGTLSNVGAQTNILGQWSIPAPASWNTPFTFFYDNFVNVNPSYNPNDKAFFTLNPGAYIQGDSAEMMSFDTIYNTGTTYRFEMKFDNLSYGTGLTNRVIGLRLKLGDTISDLITSSSTNVANYSNVITTVDLEATGVDPKLSIIAEVTENVYVEGPEFTWFVGIDYIRAVSTLQSEFVPGSFIPAETISFCENDNRWKSFWSFIPEWMDSYGVKLVSWIDGKLYIHNSNENYGNYYGKFYPAQLDVVANSEPMKVKTLLTIGENATHPWEAYEITTPADEMHPNGQLSESAFQDFVMKEGVYYAPVLRDANTPNIPNPLIQGEPMKGRTAKFKLRNIMDIFTKMFTFNANWIYSERSNK